MDPKKPEDPQQILRRIQKESPQEKKAKTLQALSGQGIKSPKQTLKSTANEYLKSKQQYLGKQLKSTQNRHLFFMTLFGAVSFYFCWSIQKKYDQLRNKARRTQTSKQREIQQQNEYITNMLNKKPFQSVPIKDEVEPERSYKFQEAGDQEEEDEGENQEQESSFGFDTKETLLQEILKEHKAGNAIPQHYQEELKKANML